MTALDDRPVITAGVGVMMNVSDCPDPVFGVVLEVHLNPLGEVATVQISRGKTATQYARFLKVVRPAVSS